MWVVSGKLRTACKTWGTISFSSLETNKAKRAQWNHRFWNFTGKWSMQYGILTNRIQVSASNTELTYGRIFFATAVITKSAASDESQDASLLWLRRLSNICKMNQILFSRGNCIPPFMLHWRKRALKSGVITVKWSLQHFPQRLKASTYFSRMQND